MATMKVKAMLGDNGTRLWFQVSELTLAYFTHLEVELYHGSSTPEDSMTLTPPGSISGQVTLSGTFTGLTEGETYRVESRAVDSNNNVASYLSCTIVVPSFTLQYGDDWMYSEISDLNELSYYAGGSFDRTAKAQSVSIQVVGGGQTYPWSDSWASNTSYSSYYYQQNSSYNPMTPGTAYTLTYVLYDGDGNSIFEVEVGFTTTGTATTGPYVTIYDGSGWDRYRPTIWTGSQWENYDPDIYDGGWEL